MMCHRRHLENGDFNGAWQMIKFEPWGFFPPEEDAIFNGDASAGRRRGA
jgi:hypothetical protein